MDQYDHYDEVDAPIYQKPKAKSTFQRELDATLKNRRSRGLAADITASEASDEEDDLISQYTRTAKSPRNQRPGSAKRRPERPSDMRQNLGDTLRPRDADNLFAQINRDESLDKEVASYDRNLPRMDNKTPSPRTGLFGRKTPTGQKTPTQENLTKEEMIFGKKTPTQDGKYGLPDSIGRKPWTPPTYQKADAESGKRTPSPAGSRGRNTPSSQLDPISESSTPRGGPKSTATTPRGGDGRSRPRLTRQPSADSDRSPRQLSQEISPRPAPRPRGSIPGGQEPPKGRTTPNIDLFGRTRAALDDNLDQIERETKEVKPDQKSPTRRFGNKTPENVRGRKTPTERGTLGRKTPEDLRKDGRKTSTGRKTPTGRKSPGVEEKPVEKKVEERSLMDMLTEDTVPAPKPQTRRRKSDLFKESSKGSISRESSSNDFQSDMPGFPSLGRKHSPTERGDSFDRSSICEEVDRDPNAKKKEQEESLKKSESQSSRQRSVDKAIDRVSTAQAQTEPTGKDGKPKRPKTGDEKNRPKPRYPTLPGETTPIEDINYEDANSIRQAIYQQWYAERMEKAKKELVVKKKKEKEEEEKKNKEKEEKLMEAKLSYNAWMEKKKETHDKDMLRKKRTEEKKREKEIEDKEEQRKAAEGSFNIWKERKTVVILDKTRQIKRAEEEKKRDEQDLKEERKKNSVSAFRGWKSKKDVELVKRAKEEKKDLKVKVREEEDEKITKDEEANDRYQEWLRNKERNEKHTRREQSLRFEVDERPPWSPANKTIPFGR